MEVEEQTRRLLEAYLLDHRRQWRKQLAGDGSGWPEDPPPCPCSLCNRARRLLGQATISV